MTKYNEIVSAPGRFKVCKKCKHIIDEAGTICECGNKRFVSEPKAVLDALKSQIDDYIFGEGLSLEEALQIEIQTRFDTPETEIIMSSHLFSWEEARKSLQ